MIFVYPASVSENCDKRIVPAVAKCIERFFLVQLQDAFASGVLTAKRIYEPSKGNYGPLLLESVNNYNNKQYLTETAQLLEWTKPRGSNRRQRPYYDMIEDIMGKYGQQELWDDPRNCREVLDKLNEIHRKVAADPNLDHDEKEEIYAAIDDNTHQIRVIMKDAEEQRGREAKRKSDDENAKEKQKGKFSTVGSYDAIRSAIDIVPTGATVSIPVLYHGGPNSGKYDKDTDVNINVKVIPTIIRNFKDLENAMLDDYFTKKSESFFKSIGRDIVRKVKGVLGRFGPLGDFVADKIGKDNIEKDIIYNSQGFVNASAFHKSSHSPSNYNYTSNIVIFNKDDLTDPEDGNIFQNRQAMQKMFKLGWSTFCMLDPVEEMMTFISSLDGGYMHEIPYRYIMESMGSKAYYGDENKLKSSVKPFMIRKGNFATFSRKFD